MNICLVSANDVMEHFASPGNIDCRWRPHVFIHLWNNVYNRWITSNFPCRWHRTTIATSGRKFSIFSRNSSEERRPKINRERRTRWQQEAARKAQRTSRSLSTAMATSSTQRQRQNTTITLQIEPMKRGNTDCQRFKKRWGDRAKLTVQATAVTRSVQCTSRISFQRTEDSLSAFTTWATLGFKVSFILQWTVYNTDNMWHVGKRYIWKQTDL